jgi:hypothetical protein
LGHTRASTNRRHRSSSQNASTICATVRIKANIFAKALVANLAAAHR